MLDNLSLHRGLQRGLETLNLVATTTVQAEAIPAALAGRDLLVRAETGSGKTLAYLIPSAQRVLSGELENGDAHKSTKDRLDAQRDAGTLVLVLVPTRELARQVEKHFKGLATHTGLQSGVIIGGSDTRYQKSVLRKNPEFLIATPGRLVELLKTRVLDFSALQTLVLDEADRMLDMGFREDVLSIIAACNPQRQTLLISATLRHTGVTRIAGEILTNPQQITVGSERSQHSQIHQQVILSDDRNHKEKLLACLLKPDTAAGDHQLRDHQSIDSEHPETKSRAQAAAQELPGDDNAEQHLRDAQLHDKKIPQKKTLVFSNTRIQADQLGGLLRYHKIRVGVLHGDLTQEERNHVVTLFGEGKINVLIASDVAARGLDVKDIDTVINFDFPRNVDDYIHRIGRTGRAGRQGLAISFITANNWNLMVAVERYTGAAFERRTIKSLKAKFTGPKKLKANGKAAGPKRKKTNKEEKSASRHRNTKNKGKRKHKPEASAAPPEPSQSTEKKPPVSRDGFTPLKRKPK